MSLTLPTVDEFIAFWGDEADDVDDDRATFLIQLAANLFWLATGLENDPKDVRMAMLVKYAICDMAIYTYITRDDIDADYSPFQSERIGSYNYSKQYNKMTAAASSNQSTGVPLFDRVVGDILDELAYGNGTVVAGQRVAFEEYLPLRVETHFGVADQDRKVRRYTWDEPWNRP